MADPSFFTKAGGIALSDVVALTGSRLTSESPDPHRVFTDIASLDRAGADDISFLDNTKYLEGFKLSQSGACFVREKFAALAPTGMILLLNDNPYYAYAQTARYFYPEQPFAPTISPQAIIGKSVTFGFGVRVDAGAVIGDHAQLGDGCWIGANTVVGDHVRIGDHSRVGANCTLSHALLGQRVLIHRGVHIGQDGFGFAPSSKGILKVPQVGRVLIGDDVEIGSGTCIDRGAGPDTVIGNGSKIDNLVQIGHNVQIGRSVFIAAQCGIAGSTRIGDGAMLGGQVGISGHLSIGSNAKIAAQAGIRSDVPAGATYGGFPAVPAREWHRQTVAISQLPGVTSKRGNKGDVT